VALITPWVLICHSVRGAVPGLGGVARFTDPAEKIGYTVHPASLQLAVQNSRDGGEQRFLIRLTLAKFADLAVGQTCPHEGNRSLDHFLSLTP
jgi:hypothetical protein